MAILPGFVSNNWRLKLAAFGLAVFLWAAVRAEPDRGNTRTLTDVPVRVEVGDLTWTTVGEPQPSTVDVRVGGSFGMFGAVDNQLTVRIPVDRITSPDTVVELRRDWVENPGNLVIQDIDPPRVRITFEETAEAAVPVSLRTTGELPEDVALAQPLSVYPAVVRVRGRASRVAELDSVRLGPLDLSTLTESGSYPVAMDTTGFGDLTFRTGEATVEVRLEEAVEQVYSGVPVVLDSVPEGVDTVEVVTRPSTIQVTLRGGRTRVAQVRSSRIEAVVPADVVDALRPGEQRVVALRLRGVPDLVRAFSPTDSVSVVRLDGEEPPPDTLLPAEEPVPDTASDTLPVTGGANTVVPDTMRRRTPRDEGGSR